MLAFGSFEFDAATRQLIRDGHELHLRPKVFALLEMLIEAAPRIVPKQAIHERLWPRGIVSDATLIALVKELRRALGDVDPDAPIVRTVHRVGYALNAPVHARTGEPAEHWLVAMDQARFALARGDNIIGRDPQARVWLDYATVSRRHALIRITNAGVWIADLGSKNGTSVAGEQIKKSVALRDGERISFGRVALTYRSSAAGLPTVSEISRATVEPSNLPKP